MQTLRVLICGLVAMAAVSHAQNTQPGSFNVQSLARPPITPMDSDMESQVLANGQFSPMGQPNVPSIPIAEAITPEIQALAAGLQSDPLRMFNYVHDHIRYVFYFGSKKGAQLTLLEKSGNDFDQCALLMAMLQSAGYTNAQYQFGWMLLPYDIADGTDRDLHHWLQLTLTNSSSSWSTTLGYLGDLIFYRGYPTYAAMWGNNIFSFQRVWIKLTIGSTAYYLDPSFKVSEPVGGINLSSAMGFSSNTLWSVSQGTDTGTYVSGLNEAAIRSTLTGCTTNLLNYMQSNYPSASSQWILGGWQIVPSTYTTLPTSLFFTTTDFGGVLPIQNWTYEPTNMMSRLAITFGGTNYQWFMPQFGGQRLSLTFDNNGLAQLWQDDTLLAQSSNGGSAGSTNVILSAHHPVGNWNPTNNTFIDNGSYDQITTDSYQRTNATYVLLYAFEPDWGWLRERQNQLDNYRLQGLSNTSRQVQSETLNIMGLNWMLQTDGSQQLLCQQLNILPMNYHRLGRMAQESGKGYYVDAYMEENSDFENSGEDAVSVEHYTREFELKNYFNSALESGIIEQLQSTNLSAASTVKMLQIANTNGQAVYVAYYGNWSAVSASLTNYDSSTLNCIYTNHILQGDIVMLPQNGSNHLAGVGSWAGYGYMALGNTMAMMISGGYHGGFSTYPGGTPDSPYIQTTGDSQSQAYTSTPISTANPLTADPVDTADGTFQLQHTDLSLGQAEPRGITLSRYYNGTRRYSNPSGMAGGWVHNYSISANAVAAPQAGLGGTTPAQMAAMLVASCASVGFYDDSQADPKNWMVTALVAKWGIDQLAKGGVSIVLGKDTVQFVKQPNGAFTPPANCTMTLAQNGSAYSLSQRHGNTFTFDSLGRLANIVDQYSQQLNVSYLNSTSCLPQTVADWKGRALTFSYTNGQLTSVGDSTGRSVSYGYSAQGDLNSFKDAESKTSSYTYDTNHQITATLDAQSRLVVSNVYDALGHLTTQYTQGDTNKMWRVFWSGWATVEYDPAGSVSAYFYDDQGRLTTTMDPLQQFTETVYDGQNRVIYTISPLSELNQFNYDANNNLTQTIDPLSQTNQYLYDSQNNLTRSLDPRGNSTTFSYNSHFSLTGVTNGAGDWVNYAYNTDGTLASRADSGGTITYDTYDNYGQLTHVTYLNSAGGSLASETFANSPLGDVTSHTDGNANATTFGYNNRRQLTTSTAPTNLVTRIAYDPVGNTASLTDARNNVTSNTWSATRHLLATTLPSTPQGVPSITNAYDSRDWLTRTVDPLSNPTSFTNDIAGRLIGVTDPLSRPTTFAYDADGRKLATTNAAQEVTSQTWDARGELIQLTDGAQHTSSRAYDPAGNQIILTNRNGNVWQFQFDGANRLTNTISPRGASTSVTFNRQGLPATAKDPGNPQASFYYDGKGRLTNRNDGVATTLYGHDANDNLTSVTEPGITNSWTFDAYNHVSSYKDVYGNLIQYRSDGNGNVTNLVYPGGRNVFYAFDSLNRLTNVTDWAGRKTSIGYDLAGHTTSLTRPNGTYRTMAYDSAGELTNIWEQMANALPIAWFRFNWANSGSMAWEFAAPLPHSNSVPTRTMTYDADNRLATFNGQDVYSDANGNLTNAPLTNSTFVSYVYDARNRLSNVGGVTNAYDACNNRLGQIYGTNSTVFVVNPNAKLPQVLMRIKNGVTTYYVYGAGLLYQVTETATTTNTLTYHFDYRGSTVALTDNNGRVTDRFEYSLYGLTTYRAGTTDTPFLFNGRYGVMTDANGLLYMRARFYNPYICRFVNADPAGFSGGLNFYAYANGNPVSYTDPSGKWAGLDDLAFTGGGAVIGAVSQGVADLVRWHWSGWTEYGYAAAAGAAAGETTLYAGPVIGAAVGAAAKNTLDQSAQMAVTGNNFNYLELGGETIKGGVAAYAAGFIPMPGISGLNAGRGSFDAVSAQVLTKLENGTIQDITWSTAGKLFVSETYGDLTDAALGGFVDGMQNNTFGHSATTPQNNAPAWNIPSFNQSVSSSTGK